MSTWRSIPKKLKYVLPDIEDSFPVTIYNESWDCIGKYESKNDIPTKYMETYIQTLYTDYIDNYASVHFAAKSRKRG